MPSASWWRAALREDWQSGGFGVYIHWPFCASKCPYCDFNSHVSARVDHARWRAALAAEIRATAATLPRRQVTSVFFGGGTPSLMEPETVGEVIRTIAEVWDLAPGTEISLEANPTSVEAGKFRAFRDAGVNRISLGVQALNDPDLKALGRLHTAAEAIGAFETARAVFERVSFDLIYARQNQSRAAWEAELREAIAIAVDHLSLYQLTIEPGTRFGDLFARSRLRGLPDDGLSADMYELTQEICASSGLSAYEVSNHAWPGAECRHNLVYWRYGDYAGIGPGAHGRLTRSGERAATVAYRDPAEWLAAVERTGSGIESTDTLDAEIQSEEMLMMGLRLTEGISLARHAALAGAPLAIGPIEALEGLGMVRHAGDRLTVTEKGRPVLNGVTKSLLFQ
ncbi:radical SAM family heme chaperone HemW [Rhodobacteraceae bacterium DSL-40]|uniref:radical SAM family heme chaperone HemW n=1 Tax=Amaricoccus sp. B4 TaxID=3368557 RepID=UPI000DAD2E5B